MRLLIDGLSLPVAQLGPDFLLVDESLDYAPAMASIVMQVDENESRWNIRLPQGMSAGNPRVAIAAAT